MVLRVWSAFSLMLSAFFLAMTLAAPAAAQERIVAVGDLHGDYDAWLDIARNAGLIDAKAA